MAEDKILSQEEIDALLRAARAEPPAPPEPAVMIGPAAGGTAGEVAGSSEVGAGEKTTAGWQEPSPVEPVRDNRSRSAVTDLLSPEEMDALGEVGNISMGSASTTLSELLNQRVSITSPRVRIVSQAEIVESFTVPYLLIQVNFTQGLEGFNILTIKLHDAMVLANLMMGGDGQVSGDEISEIEISAAAEAMNQMIGTASTSLATMFGRTINISPPVTRVLRSVEDARGLKIADEDPLVVIAFRLTVGDLIDSEIMQIMSVATAKEEAALLWNELMKQSLGEESVSPPVEERAKEESPAGMLAAVRDEAAPAPPSARGEEGESLSLTGVAGGGMALTSPVASLLSEAEQRKLELLLDIPLRVRVVLGRTRRPIKEVLSLTPGAIVELDSFIDEPVEVLVNDVLVARGEVVVVNENFGVRITSIITPEERIRQLMKSK